MAPKKSRKVVQETMVEEPTQDPNVPTQDPNVPPQAMSGEKQKDSEGEQDHDSHEDHESEEEQPNVVLFSPEQLEVLLKMNRPDFGELVAASREDHPKVCGSSPLGPGTLKGLGTERLWMLGLRKWKITSMPPRLVGTQP
jgi:hypothetical protein